MSYVRFYSSTYTQFTLGTYNNTKYWDGTLQYSYDGTSWTTWDGTTTLDNYYSPNWSIYLRGTGNTHFSTSTNMNTVKFVLSGEQLVDSEGNIESLLDYQTVDNNQHISLINYPYTFSSLFRDCQKLRTAPSLGSIHLGQYCYYSMFYGCTSLITPPELPATNLLYGHYCYRNMFVGCTSLTVAPNLPATTLASYCYAAMFYNCTNLTTPPELPATNLASYCYYGMFQGCTNLTTPPELPATILSNYCYNQMFMSCTSLTTSPKLPAIKLATGCYQNMFYGCTGLTSISTLPATILTNNCYAGIFNVSNITLTTAPDSTHTTEFRIPMIGTISTTATSWNTNMFPTSSAVQAPDINTTYYVNISVISSAIDYMVTKSELSSIASAIREKTGNNIPLTYPDDFISELNNIQPGEMTTFLSGSSLPANSLGVDGDLYTYTGS